MPLTASLPIGKIAGIKIKIHWSFIVFLIWVITGQVMEGGKAIEIFTLTLFILSLFACITFHELGHALTAKKFKVITQDITLFPFGGVAHMDRIPDKPRDELLISAAGPAVNIVIAGVLILFMLVSRGIVYTPTLFGIFTSYNFLPSLITANIVLALFNLIPAFPMDGGRILRAILSLKTGRLKATKTASYLGQIIAVFFMIIGIFYNPMLVLIGIFLFAGARIEALQATTLSALNGLKVSDVMIAGVPLLQETDTLSAAAVKLLESQDKEFFVMRGNKMTGTLNREELLKGIKSLGDSVPVSEIMRKDFVSLTTDMAVEDALKIMEEHHATSQPVFSKGILTGILEAENIAEYISIKTSLAK